tara:strand:+ start:457 stop:900 length:444 start_codon:yes stop_codon:yes gene_type:complete
MTNEAGVRIFPKINATSRTYTPGEWPTKEFVALDGTKTYLRFGNKRTDSTLELTFNNITDSQADEILDNYVYVNEKWSDTVEGTRWVVFTEDRGLNGADITSGLPSYLRELNLRWRYAKPPKVKSVQKGISNVTCSFVACLDSPKLN